MFATPFMLTAISTCSRSGGRASAFCISTIRSPTGRPWSARRRRSDGAGRRRDSSRRKRRPDPDRSARFHRALRAAARGPDGVARRRAARAPAGLCRDRRPGGLSLEPHYDIAAVPQPHRADQVRGQPGSRQAEEPGFLLVFAGPQARARGGHRRHRRLAGERGRGRDGSQGRAQAEDSGDGAWRRNRQLRSGDAADRRRSHEPDRHEQDLRRSGRDASSANPAR